MTDIVARQLAKKIKLENRLKPKLRRMFNQIGKDVAVFWSVTGKVPSLNSYNVDLTALLRDHYRAIEKAFKNTTRDELKCFLPFLETKQLDDEIDDEINQAIIAYIAAHSIVQSGIILRTTEKELQSIAAKIISNANLRGQIVTTRETAVDMQAAFKKRTAGRISVISATETQTPAEAIKFLEAEELSTVIDATPGTQKMFKTWNTVLDEVTRPSHVQADRQRVPTNQPFIVQGQMLKIPGDTSLGATLDNIIECRCSAVFNVEGQESSPLDIPRGLI